MLMAELKRKSCCCGATESNPCACMKKGIMKCSAKEPMCQCYKDLKKQGKHPDDLKKSFDSAWIVVKRDVRDPIHGSVPDKTAMVGVKGTDIKPLRRQGHTQKNKVFKRKTGDPTAGSKGNKDTDATPAEKRVKAKLRRLNLVGERGDPKQNS